MNYKGFQIEPIEQSAYNNGNHDYIIKCGDFSKVIMNTNPKKLVEQIDEEIIRQEYEYWERENSRDQPI